MEQKKKKTLGESLVEEGLISAEQLQHAQAQEKKTGQRLGKVLVKMGLISEEDLAAFIGAKYDVPRVELADYLIDPKTLDMVPEELARKYALVPILKIGNRLTCAMADPWNILALDEIRLKTGLIVESGVATETEIKKVLDEYYGVKGTMEEVIKSIDEAKLAVKEEKEIDIKKLEGIVEEPLVIRLVNLIMVKAIRERASDVHIEPEQDVLKIRFRIDGMLHEVSSPPKHLQSAVISRIKIMSNLDIAERRAPQDGRFGMKLEGDEIDVRVSCVPTIHGENVVLRLLDVSRALMGLNQLGFPAALLEKYERLISHPHGMILVTGPTGCGKTTTLYASLQKINTEEKNIITIEDPVEYDLAGIRQIQVNPKANVTFANGLRSILRQDPDVIMVGEIRDIDTAELAIQAALTGHLVFSTLHTNDAPGAITRLIDMGAESFLVSSSVTCVLAQRLVRKICFDCKEEYVPSQAELSDIGLGQKPMPIKFYRGRGCPKCIKTGYKSRVGIFELMVTDEKIHNLTTAKSPLEEIRRQAIESGMRTMKEDGIRKIEEGITTVEEVLRVTQEE